MDKAVRKEGTVLICDIRHFTSLFERRDPIEAVEFANSVLARPGNEVEKNNGKLDRFIGDGFLAHFGILGEHKNHVYDACRSAIVMRNALQKINNQR